MRKLRFSHSLILTISSLGLLFFMLFFALKSAATDSTIEETCPKIEQVKGTELIWESLSRQFITSVSPY